LLVAWLHTFACANHAAERPKSLKVSRPNIILTMTD